MYTKRLQPFVILLTLEFKLFIFTANTCTSQYFSFSGLFFVCESDLSLLRLVFDKRPSLLASAIDPAESVNTPGSWLTDPASTISKKLDRWCTVPKHECCRHTQNIALQRQGSVKPIQRYMRLQHDSTCKRYQVTARHDVTGDHEIVNHNHFRLDRIRFLVENVGCDQRIRQPVCSLLHVIFTLPSERLISFTNINALVDKL